MHGQPRLSPQELQVASSIASRHDLLLADLDTFVAARTGPGPNQGKHIAALRDLIGHRLAALGAQLQLASSPHKPAWLATPSEANADPSTTDRPTALYRRLLADSPTPSNPTPDNPSPAFLIAGHLDTVHSDGSGFDRLTLSSDGKTATGPGIVDMKGGLVIALHALEVLHASGIPISWTFLLNGDEETGSFYSDHAIRAEASTHQAGHSTYRYGLALEPAVGGGAQASDPLPACWKLALARGGSGQLALHATGKRAHVGRDFTAGRSAVSALCQSILDIHALSDPASGICLNISPLWCPDAANVVAGEARAWGNVRYPSPQAMEQLDNHFTDLQTKWHTAAAQAGGLPKVDILRTFNRPAKPASEQTKALATHYQSVLRSLGSDLEYMTSAGVCDGNNMQAAGLPTIDSLGVRGGGLHTGTEWIELSSLVERCQALAVLLMRLVH